MNRYSSRIRRRRRNRRLAAYGCAALIMAVSVSGVWWSVMKKNKGGVHDAYAAGIEMTPYREESENTTLPTEVVSLNGVEITGLTRQQAEELLLKTPWSLSVENGEETVSVDNFLKTELERVLNEIYGDGDAKPGNYTTDSERLEESARALVNTLAEKWDRSVVNSQLLSFDKEKGSFTYSEAQSGRTMNQQAAVEAIMAAVKSGKYDARIAAEFTVTEPERTAAQAKEQYRVIGTFTTKTTDNRNRNQNILLAVEAIDGKVIKPGEEFSFNSTTGNRTKEKGYQPAGAYRNGVLIEEPGGGVCQVSTTLYNAVVGSGLNATERHSHSYPPGYIQSGEDAMVSFDGYAGPDLKFVNTGKSSVAVRASLKDNVLKVSVIGLPILDEGVKVTMRSEKVKEIEAPTPVVEENKKLAAGTERVVDNGQNGSVWKTFRVVTKNGQVVEETPLHNTTYRGKAAVIQKNSDIPAEESGAAEESGLGANAGNETAPGENGVGAVTEIKTAPGEVKPGANTGDGTAPGASGFGAPAGEKTAPGEVQPGANAGDGTVTGEN